MKKHILVIGATGNVGRPVVTALREAGVGVRALTRDPNGAPLPEGVEAACGDLTAPATLDAALDGVDAVFLVWTAPRPAVASALERIAGRVRRIVALTSPHKTPHPFFQQPNAIRGLHAEIEQRIEDSGVEWTILRPGMLASNARFWWGPQIQAGEAIRWPYLSVPTAPIDERDIAAVAVRALCEEGHDGKEYVLTGPEALTQREQVETIGKAARLRLRIEELTPDEARRELVPPFAPPVMEMLLAAWAAGEGRPAWVTETVGDVTGGPPRRFAEWAGDHRAAFRT